MVEYMDRAQGATQGFLPQNLHGTPTSSAESSGRRYVAAPAALLGDGRAAWHLATSAEAVDRGLMMRSSDEIRSPDIGAQYHSQLSAVSFWRALSARFVSSSIIL